MSVYAQICICTPTHTPTRILQAVSQREEAELAAMMERLAAEAEEEEEEEGEEGDADLA